MNWVAKGRGADKGISFRNYVSFFSQGLWLGVGITHDSRTDPLPNVYCGGIICQSYHPLSCMVGSRKGWVLELSTLTLFPHTCIGVPTKANAFATNNEMMYLHLWCMFIFKILNTKHTYKLDVCIWLYDLQLDILKLKDMLDLLHSHMNTQPVL